MESFDVNDLVNCYNKTLNSILDQYAPLKTKTVRTKRPIVPWFNEQVMAAKRQRRKAEKKWRRTNLNTDLADYKVQKNQTTFVMNCAGKADFISQNSTNQRKLFQAAKILFTQRSDLLFSEYAEYGNPDVLANDIGDFFVQKIERIHAEFDSSAHETSHSSVPEFNELMSRFDSFDILNEVNVKDLISKSSKKSCSLDPMPTSLVLKCQDILLPMITRMINLSLQSGVFCDEWKQALVQSQLKKSKTETVFENLRPISNLTFTSKLTERAVFNQTNDYLNLYQLYPKAQSAYRKYHSTETLLRVKHDILMNMNRQHVTLLVILDLSAAFDTVDHHIMLERLKSCFGIQDQVLKWFTSYLSNRSQFISVNGGTCKRFELKNGVPQGSCLGPLLFALYVSKLFHILESHFPDAHAFAMTINCTFHSNQIQCLNNCLRLLSWKIVLMILKHGC